MNKILILFATVCVFSGCGSSGSNSIDITSIEPAFAKDHDVELYDSDDGNLRAWNFSCDPDETACPQVAVAVLEEKPDDLAKWVSEAPQRAVGESDSEFSDYVEGPDKQSIGGTEYIKLSYFILEDGNLEPEYKQQAVEYYFQLQDQRVVRIYAGTNFSGSEYLYDGDWSEQEMEESRQRFDDYAQDVIAEL